MKTAAVLIEDGAFAPFYCPHCRAFGSSCVPFPRKLTSKEKKMIMPGG